MSLTKSCREVTRLVLESQDRRLNLPDRLGLRLHWMACGACRRFKQQAQMMRGAMNRWRHYSDE